MYQIHEELLKNPPRFPHEPVTCKIPAYYSLSSNTPYIDKPIQCKHCGKMWNELMIYNDCIARLKIEIEKK